MYIKRIDTKTSGTEYTVQKYIHPCIVNLFLTKKEIQFYVGRMVFAVVLEQVTTIWEKKDEGEGNGEGGRGSQEGGRKPCNQ